MSGYNKEKQPNYEKAKLTAIQLLSRYNVTDLPIPIVKIANDLGIDTINVINMEQFDGGHIGGFLLAEENSFKIYLNKILDKKEQTYILAHELGHYMLHKEEFIQSSDIRPFIMGDDVNYNKLHLLKDEIEADVFAMNFLLPEKIFMKYYLKDLSVKTMSDLFNVPIRKIKEKASPFLS